MEAQKRPHDGDKLREPLTFFIEGKKFRTQDRYKSGAELKNMADIPSKVDLYLEVQVGYEPALIGNNEKIDLARGDVERFFVKDKLTFTINGITHVSYKQYITETEIRHLGAISEDENIYLKIAHPYEDELIEPSEEVDLARPGKEHFVSKSRKPIKILINGKQKTWDRDTITYGEVVELAKQGTNNGNIQAYTVTYFDGPKVNPSGEMVKGDRVFVKNKMIFNAIPTDKS